MEERVELFSGLAASILGLLGVVAEAQALSNPVANPSLSWILGSGSNLGVWNAIQITHHALLPMAVIFAALALGAYLHAVHRQTTGLALLVSSGAVVIVVLAFAVFNSTYVQILFVPAVLVVLTAVLAAAASVCALSSMRWPASMHRRVASHAANTSDIRLPEGP